MTPLDHLRFFRLWLGAAVAAVGVVALFNLLVDPIGAFPPVHLSSLDLFRPRVELRPSKAELAHRPGWEIVTLGSSRVLHAMPADYPLFRTNRTANLALTGPVLPELATVLQTVRAHNGKPPRMVIFGIDYYMFAMEGDHILDFMETRFNPDLDRLDYYAKRLIGVKATEDSIKTVKNWIRGRALSLQDQNGFLKTKVGDDFAHRPIFDRMMRHLALGYRPRPYAPDRPLEVLRGIIRGCREQNIDLRFVIMPCHALEIELLHACGKGENVEDFKRAVVRLLADEKLEGKVPLLDATGYTGPLTEEVPPAEVRGLTMKYFIENGHALPPLGEMVLNRLFDTDGTNQFGVFLTTANIEGHLQQERKDRAEYLRTHPEDGQWPHRIVASLPPLKRKAGTNAPAKNP